MFIISAGEGNVFTSICLSTGGRVSLVPGPSRGGGEYPGAGYVRGEYSEEGEYPGCEYSEA